MKLLIRMTFVFLLIPLILVSAEFEKKIDFDLITNWSKTMENERPIQEYYSEKILVPMGHKISNLSVTLYDKEIERTEKPKIYKTLPISKKHDKNEFEEANFTGILPKADFVGKPIQYRNGYGIFTLNIFPDKYNFDSKEKITYKKALIKLETVFDEAIFDKQNKKLVRKSEIGNLSNLSALSSYKKQSFKLRDGIIDSENPVEMIIVGSSEFETRLTDYKNWRNNSGVSTDVYFIEDILTEYTGEDDAEKLRNFVINAYEVFGTTDQPLKYLLLAGDDEIIPNRGTYGEVGSYTDNHIPTDIYFSNLDGNWNANQNEIYGESDDDVDFYPEISIGRFPIDTAADFDNLIHKIKKYTDTSSYTDDRAVFFGENLNWDPVTWGGDYKDEIRPFLPVDYKFSTCYQRDDSYSPEIIFEELNEGAAVINHMGHANETMVFGQSPSSAQNLTNTEFGFAYTQGCYPAAFDEPTSGAGESVGENLVTSQGGLHTFIGNTRYGWYSPGNTNGASQFYDIEFFKGLFEENHLRLGDALKYSREVLVDEAMNSGVMRWVFYEMILFGDPSLELKLPLNIFPNLEITDFEVEELEGDGDGAVNPGEKIELYIDLFNLENWSTAEEVNVTLSAADENLTVLQNESIFSDLEAGEILSNTDNPFVIEIDDFCPLGVYELNFDLEVEIEGYDNYTKLITKEVEISMNQTNWPWHSQFNIYSVPIVCDYDNDDNNEILSVNSYGITDIISTEAENLGTIQTNDNFQVFSNAAFANLGNDDIPDIVAAGRNGTLFSYNLEGELNFQLNMNAYLLNSPVISNFGESGELMIAVVNLNKELLIVDPDGETMNIITLSDLVLEEIAAAPMNSDDKAEICYIQKDGLLNLIGTYGSSLPNFPVQLSGNSDSAPIILNNKNIVVSTSEKIYVISPQGEILTEVDNDYDIQKSIIASQLDSDEELELIFTGSSGKIVAMEQNGEIISGFPVTIDEDITNPPLSADFNNDNQLDIAVFTSHSDFYVFGSDGSEIISKIPSNEFSNNPGLIRDFDQDGDWEAICSSANDIHIYDLSSESNILEDGWLNYRKNYMRTAYYDDSDFTSTSDSEAVPMNKLKLKNYPNPFNPETKIAFYLPEETDMELSIYNIRGRKVKTLLKDHFDKGSHEIVWNGKNNRGKSVASGIYLYKLRTKNRQTTEKMLLLK